jgi:iron complex transport system permease protein
VKIFLAFPENLLYNKTVNKKISFISLFAGLIGFSLLGITVGPTGFKPPSDVILCIRLPRIILAIFAGWSLGVTGAAFQGILQNPLADPYILGVSGGACAGAALAIVLGLKSIQLFSFIGSIITIFLVYRLASFKGRAPKETLILSGVVVGTLASSIVMLLMSIAGRSLDEIVYLLMGHLGVVFDSGKLITLYISVFIVLICSIFIYLRSRELNVLSLGEEEALSAGVDVEKNKKYIFVLGSLIVGLTVATCGAIGFVGLMVPHLARMSLGPDYRFLIPGAGIIGAILLIAADILARSIMPYELPVGVVTAILGVPFFIYLLRREKRD